tara:strand:+ start:339 stop:866 length:528 start_codon:yes stop_codon:yes gene_type:complete
MSNVALEDMNKDQLLDWMQKNMTMSQLNDCLNNAPSSNKTKTPSKTPSLPKTAEKKSSPQQGVSEAKGGRSEPKETASAQLLDLRKKDVERMCKDKKYFKVLKVYYKDNKKKEKTSKWIRVQVEVEGQRGDKKGVKTVKEITFQQLTKECKQKKSKFGKLNPATANYLRSLMRPN